MVSAGLGGSSLRSAFLADKRDVYDLLMHFVVPLFTTLGLGQNGTDVLTCTAWTRMYTGTEVEEGSFDVLRKPLPGDSLK